MRHQSGTQSHPVPATIWKYLPLERGTPTPSISGSLGTNLTRAGVSGSGERLPTSALSISPVSQLLLGLGGWAAATELVLTLIRMVTSPMEVRDPWGRKHRAEPHISMGCSRNLGVFLTESHSSSQIPSPKSALPGAEALGLDDAVSRGWRRAVDMARGGGGHYGD